LFQADDRIRDRNVTGVQTCALPIFLARLAQNRLHRPDPWESVKLRFRATRLDRALLEDSRPTGSAIPEALMRLEPHTAKSSGWPAARAGVLGSDVVYGAVGRHLLGLDVGAIDMSVVMEVCHV